MRNHTLSFILLGLFWLLCPGRIVAAPAPSAAAPIARFDFLGQAKANKVIALWEPQLADPKSEEAATRQIAWAYLGSGRPEQAIPWFDRLIALRRYRGEDYAVRGLALFQLVRSEEARADCFLSRFSTGEVAYPAGWYGDKGPWMFPGLRKALKKEFKVKTPGLDLCLAYEAVSRVSRDFHYKFIQSDPHVETPKLESFASQDPYVQGFTWSTFELQPYHPEATRHYSVLDKSPKGVNPAAVGLMASIRALNPVGRRTYDEVVGYFSATGDTRSVVALGPGDPTLYDQNARTLMEAYFARCSPYAENGVHCMFPNYERRGPFGEQEVMRQMELDRKAIEEALTSNATALAISPANKEYADFRAYLLINQKIQRKAAQLFTDKENERGMISAMAAFVFLSIIREPEEREDWEKQNARFSER